jgi:Spy/CpxP family protein refolding chaperone
MNKKWEKTALVSMVALFLFSGAPAIVAQPGPDEDVQGKMQQFRERMEKKMDNIIEELGLSPEQKEAILEHKKSHRQEMEETHKAMREKHDALKAELEKEELDQARIKALVAEIKELEGSMVDARVEGILAIRKILTLEQFKIFQEKTKSLHKKRGKCHKHNRGEKGGER